MKRTPFRFKILMDIVWQIESASWNTKEHELGNHAFRWGQDYPFMTLGRKSKLIISQDERKRKLKYALLLARGRRARKSKKSELLFLMYGETGCTQIRS